MKTLSYNEALELYKKVMNPPYSDSVLGEYRKNVAKGLMPPGTFWYLNEFTYNMWMNRNSNNPVNMGDVTYKDMFESFNYIIQENQRVRDIASLASYPSDGSLY